MAGGVISIVFVRDFSWEMRKILKVEEMAFFYLEKKKLNANGHMCYWLGDGHQT